MPRLTIRTTTIPSAATKRALVDRLTQATVQAYGVEPFAVTVEIVERDPAQWGRGGRLINEKSAKQ